ncbi:class E sortase [Streptomyces sp. 4N509B]|uniref:class E sortase n=1 Tax=Streptomyces sp. 4N509B TaxID=3457413 RepID=UPI003FD2629B
MTRGYPPDDAERGWTSDGDPSYGDPSHSYGEAPYADPFSGASYGDASYRDPSYGDPSYGDPSYGDASYGDASYGDPGYAHGYPEQADPGGGGASFEATVQSLNDPLTDPLPGQRTTAAAPDPYPEATDHGGAYGGEYGDYDEYGAAVTAPEAAGYAVLEPQHDPETVGLHVPEPPPRRDADGETIGLRRPEGPPDTWDPSASDTSEAFDTGGESRAGADADTEADDGTEPGSTSTSTSTSASTADTSDSTSAVGGRAARRRAAAAAAAAASARGGRRRATRGPASPTATATDSRPPAGSRAASRSASRRAAGSAPAAAAEPPPGAGRAARRKAAKAAAKAARQTGTALSNVIGELFITTGVLLMLFVVYQLWWTNYEARAHANREREELQQEWDSSGNGQGDPARDPGAFSPGEGFAVLYMPTLDVVVPIAETTDEDSVLNNGMVGHYAEEDGLPTAMPWDEEGNVGLAGHRNTHGEPFRYINRLEPGDPIVIETADAYYTYAMTSRLDSTSPSNVEVLDPVPTQGGFTDPGRYITLTTCTPEFTSTYRLIVWGEMVEERPRQDGLPDALVG